MAAHSQNPSDDVLPPAGKDPKTAGGGAWMALVAALLGWLFDGAEMGVFSMVGRAAVQDMLGFGLTPTPEQEQQIGFYFGIIIAVFLVGAATGGVVFGWLGDRVGRVRAMSLSVLTYAVFTGLCGIAQTPLQLGILRFIASLGMGGEWALGVALVMEVWPNKSRAFMAGLIGAAANVGYMLVGFIGMGLGEILHHFETWLPTLGLGPDMVQSLVAFKGWRLLMIMGTLPAVLTFFFRIFVPESHKWEEEKAKGGTSNWATVDLLGVILGAMGPGLIVYVWGTPGYSQSTRVVGTLIGVVVAVVGYTYPVYRYLQRTIDAHERGVTTPWPTVRKMMLGALLSGVALLGTWGSTQWAPTWAGQLTQGTDASYPREWTQIYLAIGAIIGTIVAAICGGRFGRRITYFVMCILSMLTAVYFFQSHKEYGTSFLVWSLLAGMTTASFYGWLPLYLPELFATRVRATGQGFAFNFGRIIAAIGNLQMSALLGTEFIKTQQTAAGITGGYPVICSFVSAIYIFGMIIIWFAPETKGRPLPE